MFIAALFVGLLTAYYFGLRPGGVAAAVVLALFLLASMVPGASLAAYILVGVGTAGVCMIGPRFAPPAEENSVRRMGKRLISLARSQIGRRL